MSKLYKYTTRNKYKGTVPGFLLVYYITCNKEVSIVMTEILLIPWEIKHYMITWNMINNKAFVNQNVIDKNTCNPDCCFETVGLTIRAVTPALTTNQEWTLKEATHQAKSALQLLRLWFKFSRKQQIWAYGKTDPVGTWHPHQSGESWWP